MAYTNIDDPSAFFQTATYAGNGGTQSITNDGNSDLQPDWIWTKSRSDSSFHLVTDSTRGTTKRIYPNSDAAEETHSNMVTAFNSDGFSIGDHSAINTNGYNYVGWQWKANGGTTASNSSGSITSTVQANQDAGFSIVTYTGNGTDGATVGHGLGAVPAMVVFKCRDTSNTDWRIYHQSISPTNALSLNSAGAQYGASGVFGGTFTSTLLKVENDTGANRNTSPMIAYCFAEKQGYSKFGKYVGNGSSNGTFVYTGFAPAFVMLKDTSQATNWEMFDVKRNPSNVRNLKLGANLAVAENGSDLGNTSQNNIDILSNGFKMRTGNTDTNVNGDTYIYMAFAENPFTTSTGIPTTAR